MTYQCDDCGGDNMSADTMCICDSDAADDVRREAEMDNNARAIDDAYQRSREDADEAAAMDLGTMDTREQDARQADEDRLEMYRREY